MGNSSVAETSIVAETVAGINSAISLCLPEAELKASRRSKARSKDSVTDAHSVEKLLSSYAPQSS